VIPFFIYVGTSPTQFFSYQLALAVIELLALVVQTYRLLPRIAIAERTPWQWAPLRGVLKFSLSIAFTGSVWVLVTQTDKLVLSKLLSLSDYAYFTLAVLVAGGVSVISGPISGAMVPRMSKLVAEGDEAGLRRLYRNATQLVGVIAIPAALMLAFFAYQVLWAWTGDADIARRAAPVLTLYALGNGILALGSFPYYLQYAKGDLKMHLIGSALFVVLLIPALIWATSKYGAVGAGWAWLGANSVYFAIWVPTVHGRFVKGLHMQWIIHDVSPIVLITLVSVVLLQVLVVWPKSRPELIFAIAVASMGLLAASITGSSVIRKKMVNLLRICFAAQV
jgi:O-antigen/teichoic acid export membrane protein